jgi:peptidoglycan/LPS O-acetylase OafA/YrhL
MLGHRGDIQGLRGLAVLLVVLAHAGVTALEGGYVGVDVFFVISGYLITGLLLDEYRHRADISLVAFYARRLRRLLPAMAVMLLVVAATATLLLSSHEVTDQTASLGYAATWTSNLYFAWSEIDYFAELRNRDLFLHTWSLGVEEQFYLIWPVLMVITLRLGKVDPERPNHYLVHALGVLLVVGLGLSWYLTETHPAQSYYLLPSRVWQFALGGLVRVFGERLAPPLNGREIWRVACGAVGVTLIICAALILSTDSPYPGLLAVVPSLGAALILYSGQGTRSTVGGRWSSRPIMCWLGDRSYSLYLWHWPILMFGYAWGAQSNPALTAGLLVIAVVCADISYRWVELPFWKGRLSHAPGRSVFLVSLLVMVGVVHVSIAVQRIGGPIEVAKSNRPAYDPRSDSPQIYQQYCDTSFRSSEIKLCALGDASASRTAVLVGDSIGAQWFSVMPELFPQPGWRIVFLTKSSCPIVDEEIRLAKGKLFEVCHEWRRNVVRYLVETRPEYIFLGSSANYRLSRRQWVDGTSRILAALSPVTRKIVVIPGTPRLSFDGPGCVERQRPPNGSWQANAQAGCVEAVGDQDYLRVARYLNEAVGRVKNATLLDLNKLVCPNGVCSAIDDHGVVVFRDSQHLTDTFVRSKMHEISMQASRAAGISSDTKSAVPDAGDSMAVRH